jgi:hypothetical protein
VPGGGWVSFEPVSQRPHRGRWVCPGRHLVSHSYLPPILTKSWLALLRRTPPLLARLVRSSRCCGMHHGMPDAQTLASDAAEAYLAPLRPVLNDGVDAALTAFLHAAAAGLSSFTVAVSAECVEFMEPLGMAWWNLSFRCEPNHLPPGHQPPHHFHGAWRSKHSQEQLVPHSFLHSPWRSRPGKPASVVLPVLFGVCFVAQDVWPACFAKVERTIPPTSVAAYVLTDDAGPCISEEGHSLHPAAAAAAQGWTSVPLLVNNGDASAPSCFNPSTSVVIPTPSLVSVDGPAAAMWEPASSLFASMSAGIEAERQTGRPRLGLFLVGQATPMRRRLADALLAEKPTHDMMVAEHLWPTEYLTTARHTKFCLQADGNAPWSPRLVESMAFGCVPVLVSDRIVPPLHRTLNWSKLAVAFPTSALHSIAPTLRAIVASGVYETLHANVLAVRQALAYEARQTASSSFFGVLPLIAHELSLASAHSAALAAVRWPHRLGKVVTPPRRTPNQYPYSW